MCRCVNVTQSLHIHTLARAHTRARAYTYTHQHTRVYHPANFDDDAEAYNAFHVVQVQMYRLQCP